MHSGSKTESSKTLREILYSRKCSIEDMALIWMAGNISPKTIIKSLSHYYKKAIEEKEYNLAYAALFGIYTTYIMKSDEIEDKVIHIVKKLSSETFTISAEQKISTIDQMLKFVKQDEFLKNALYFKKIVSLTHSEIKSEIDKLITPIDNLQERIKVLDIFVKNLVIFNRDYDVIHYAKSVIGSICDTMTSVATGGDAMDPKQKEVTFKEFIPSWEQKKVSVKEFIPSWLKSTDGNIASSSSYTPSIDDYFRSIDDYFRAPQAERNIWSPDYHSEWPTLVKLDKLKEPDSIFQIGEANIFDQ
jgi:hypothetical protein